MMKDLNLITALETTSDEALVMASLGGDRTAFGQIVERYQRLLCSLAYSAIGDLGESEDVAQEAFLTAWQKLGDLKEPAKLRPWLCGIVRFKASRLRRIDAREPVRHADDSAEMGDISTDDLSVSDSVIRQEEQAILWHALEQIPTKYREPLVLYYREYRSVEHVAVELDLKEDAVKQRLSRGRKMLQEQVMAFVEGALLRSTPGKLFTIGVLASLPVLSPPAKAAGVGAAMAVVGKGASAIAKLTLVAAVLASVSGLISSVMALRMNLEQARTQSERRNVVVGTAILLGSFVAFIAALFGLRGLALARPEALDTIMAANHLIIAGFTVGWTWLFLRQLRTQAELRRAERKRHPERFTDSRYHRQSKASEYVSAASLFGVPLVHVRFGMQETGQRPAFGWIAAGDTAVGLLFAFGGWAVGFFAIGAISVGVISFGGIGFGILAAGAICVGWWALGAVSVGVHAFGSTSATAWETAQGGNFVWSNYVALGPQALTSAPHANDTLAWLTLYNPQGEREWLIYCVIVVILSIVPTALYAKTARKRYRDSNSDSSG
jgi:RNA polymerase sigma factor (sigma-70 family)